MKVNAFSLIELMVVIAIVAILAVMAVPAYKNFMYRAKVASTFEKLKPFVENLAREHSKKGVMPNTMVVNGVTLSRITQGWYYVNWGNVVNGLYQGTNDGGMVSFTIAGLEGIPNYVAPTASTPNGTSRNMIHLAIRHDGTIYKFACGSQLLYSLNAIPTAYLPSICTCTDLDGFFSGTANC